jgi:FkbM family methyltransferase
LTYLEIGALRGGYCSNTCYFYKNGARGVLVEAHPKLIKDLESDRQGDIILNVAVGLEDDVELEYYTFDGFGGDTLSKEEAMKRVKLGQIIKETIKVPVATINRIISQNFKNDAYPDFLSIDIEGMDFAVLKTLDYEKYPIPVICAETCAYSPNHIRVKDFSIQEFLLKKGYFMYADTNVNTIFVNNDWFYNTI